MVSIRVAQLDDLVGMQAANLHCLPENYQVLLLQPPLSLGPRRTQPLHGWHRGHCD